jgi:muconolactone delta-isomerase
VKILSIGKPKDAFSSLPPGTIKRLFEASMAAMQQQQKEGRLLEFYASPVGTGRSIVILDYKNGEDWEKDIMAIPVLNYYEQEVYPLADGFEACKAMLEALAASGA